MSLKDLKRHLLFNDRRQTQVEEMPPDDTPAWAREQIKAKSEQYAREHEREERKQRRELERQKRQSQE